MQGIIKSYAGHIKPNVAYIMAYIGVSKSHEPVS